MGEPETIRFGSSRNEIWMLRICVACYSTLAVICLVWAVYDADWKFSLMAAFWGLMASLSYVGLLPDSCYLELTPNGFTERQVFLTWSRRWQDVEFFIATKDSEGDVVAFRYIDGCPRSLLSKLNESKTGVSGSLMASYGTNADELAGILNAWRLRFHPKPAAKSELSDSWV